jgi:type I restriction enzyme M protein
MMVRLIKPKEHDIYDPCCGSGGMLILAKEYIDEHGGNPQGQPLRAGGNGGGVVHRQDEHAAARHQHADLRNDDTLAEPQHVEGGELMRFDRVLTNPPFSIKLHREERRRQLGAPPRALPLRLVPWAARRPT